MNISSFDIFDTCLLRKCGAPANFFDVLSLRVFNGEVEETVRQEFVAARLLAQQSVQSTSMTLRDIWDAFAWTHPLLKFKEELCLLEQETEREMLVPVLRMRDKVDECRAKGNRIVFISDMYLPSAFLCEVMREHGFMKEGDSLYVSCECKADKWNGGLFGYVKEKEQLSYRKWHHYGDNKQSDYDAPRKLGIRATLIKHEYTPYQKQWMENDYTLGFKYARVMAGMGRALHYSTEWTTHTDFVLDLIAPFYCSLVYRMMRDAEQRGIKRLYFCARDAYMMYLIAEKYKPLFPNIECRFLYISRKALYEGDPEAKMAYFVSMGLATKEDYVGVVDIRSSGKTLQYLNKLLTDQGYNSVRGYYYELFIARSVPHACSDYYCEMSGTYDAYASGKMVDTWQIWENFMPMNRIPKTVDYRFEEGSATPVFGSDSTDGTLQNQQFSVREHDYWCGVHERLLLQYCEAFVENGLYRYCDSIFHSVCMPTIFSLIDSPRKEYLAALEDLSGKKVDSGDFLHFVRKESWLRLLFTHAKDSIWKHGTLCYNGFDKVFYGLKRVRYGKH